MPEYLGGKLYPAGKKYPNPPAVAPDFSYTVSVAVDWDRLEKADADCCRAMRAEYDRLPMLKPPHVVGGAGYVHSIPNYGRVLKEGLDRYAERVAALPEGDFRAGWKRFSRASAHITPGRWRCWRRRERTRSS